MAEHASAASNMTALLRTAKVLVCAGSGGVGKTTMSAALAIEAARQGRRTVVITIDPAKRLATSLGLETLSSTPTDLTANVDRELKASGDKPCKGRFLAVMPDTTQTFETFVRSMAGENEGAATRILKTSIYKIFAREFSGTHEYMAMAKLYDLYNEGKYDLIVLDTPPSANTRMFLEAPRLLSEFFDDSIMRWFLAPGAKFFASGVRKMLGLMEKLTGHGFMSEMIEFTTALFELQSQFRENLATIGQLLHLPGVNFLMVTSPERLSKTDTQDFVKLITAKGFRFWGFVVNRTLSRRLGIAPETIRDLGANGSAEAMAEGDTHGISKSLIRYREQWAEKLQAGEASGRAGKRSVSKTEIDLLAANFDLLLPQLTHELDAARFLAGVTNTPAPGGNSQVLFVPEQAADVHSLASLLNVVRELVVSTS